MQYRANRKVTTGVFSVMFCKVQKYLGAGKYTPFPFSKAEKAKKHLFRCKKKIPTFLWVTLCLPVKSKCSRYRLSVIPLSKVLDLVF